MNYAIISLAGKQYYIKEGDRVRIPEGSSDKLEVLLFGDGKSTLLDKGAVKEVKIALVKEGTENRKVMVKRFRAKSRYRKTKGHKQGLIVYKVKSVEITKKPEKTTKVTTAETDSKK